jgi:hypothetical protein
MNLRRTSVLWVALTLGSQGVLAETMDCGGSVIDDAQDVPASAAQVLASCGEPTSREGGEWIYERPGQFTNVLKFDSDGNLQSISSRPGNE